MLQGFSDALFTRGDREPIPTALVMDWVALKREKEPTYAGFVRRTVQFSSPKKSVARVRGPNHKCLGDQELMCTSLGELFINFSQQI